MGCANGLNPSSLGIDVYRKVLFALSRALRVDLDGGVRSKMRRRSTHNPGSLVFSQRQVPSLTPGGVLDERVGRRQVEKATLTSIQAKGCSQPNRRDRNEGPHCSLPSELFWGEIGSSAWIGYRDTPTQQ
jgi:hypothetical protein